MRVQVRKAIFGVLGVVLLCLPATAWAVPLDNPEVVVDTTLAQTQPLEAPNLSRDAASLEKELLVSIGYDTVILEPNAPYEIFLDDISLGLFTSDSNGQLFVQVKLPLGTLPGSYMLNVTDQNVLIAQKTIQITP